jgi:hypothetical protein
MYVCMYVCVCVCVCVWGGAANDADLIVTKAHVKNGVFWDVEPCGSCKNRRFGGSQRLYHEGDKKHWARNNVSSN